MPEQAIVILHLSEGDVVPAVRIVGDNVRVFWIDENAPHNRIYEMTSRDDPSIVRELIPEESVIGSSKDDRHAAIANRINSFLDGRSIFSAVPDEEPRDG